MIHAAHCTKLCCTTYLISQQGQIRRVPLANIFKWQRGQDTAVFRKHPQPKALARSFSIFYYDEWVWGGCGKPRVFNGVGHAHDFAANPNACPVV